METHISAHKEIVISSEASRTHDSIKGTVKKVAKQAAREAASAFRAGKGVTPPFRLRVDVSIDTRV